MPKQRFALLLIATFVAVTAIGCGSGSTADIAETLTITPATATVNHAVFAPDNSQTFKASDKWTCNHAPCPSAGTPNPLVNLTVTWGDSDNVNTQLLANPDGSAVVTCLNPTNGPVTIQANAPAQFSTATLVATATLTCT